jgi:hypothetical protein
MRGLVTTVQLSAPADFGPLAGILDFALMAAGRSCEPLDGGARAYGRHPRASSLDRLLERAACFDG